MSLIDQDITTPLYSLDGKWFEGKCVKCYDADSVHMVFEYNGVFMRFKCRLYGIDTPEIRTKNTIEKKVAKEARDYLRSLILDKIIFVQCHTFDKYGRLLITIFTSAIESCNAESTKLNVVGQHVQKGGCLTTFDSPTFDASLNNHFIQKGYAYAYEGGKRKPFSEWFNHTIIHK